MNIDDTKKASLSHANRIGNTTATKQALKTGESQSQPQAVQKASVSVSSSGSVSDAIRADTARRSQRVAQIKLDVNTGQYQPDSLQTADKILEFLADYSLG